jgi:hypothetical protein
MIAANFRIAGDGLYAADAALECALADLGGEPDWNGVLSGARPSSLVDGSPAGTRRLSDGGSIDLAQVLNLANCQKKTTCGDADMDARSPDRPWGANNPRWKLYGYGWLANALGTQAAVRSPYYVVSMVADDPSETDGDATRDGGSVNGSPSPGLGVVMVRAEAFGPRGAHRIVEATAVRHTTSGGLPDGTLRILGWKEVRH